MALYSHSPEQLWPYVVMAKKKGVGVPADRNVFFSGFGACRSARSRKKSKKNDLFLAAFSGARRLGGAGGQRPGVRFLKKISEHADGDRRGTRGRSEG